jgi:hypothetical protein
MRKPILFGALLLSVACSSKDGGTGPAVVTTVDVTFTPTQITVNGTAQASAIVKDQNGSALTGKTITWTSLNPGVATVTSAGGVITGVAVGSATIRGSVEGVIGSAVVVVIAPVSSCSTGPTTVDLVSGGVGVLSANATKGCIKVPAAPSAPADYLVIPANTNSIPDVVGDYMLRSDEGETVPANNLIPSNTVTTADRTPVTAVGDLGAVQFRFESRLRLEERRELRLPDAQRAYHARFAGGQQRFSVSSAIPAIGDKLNFKVPQQEDACNKFTTITAAVQYINDKTIIYTDVAAPTGGFTATDYQQIGDEFANLIYPTDVSYFGTPLDLDANGRIIILYTPEVNKLTPSGQTSFVGGFFFAGDLFPATPPNPGDFACKQSNVAELFYLLAPDPDGTINNNRRSTANVRQGTRGTIAHEFQHMINASERIRSPIEQPFENVWLDEALAHFAEDAVGRALRGIGEAEDAGFVRNFGGSADDFNAFFFQNFARFAIYLKNPGPFSPTSAQADTSLAVRGAGWSLLHYAADQYAPGGDIKAYTKKLAGGPDTGVVNLTKNAGGVSFDVLISGWMVANYADNLGIPGLSTTYTYKVYDIRNNEQNLPSNFGLYPLKVNSVTGSGFVLTGLQARSGSGNYFFGPRNAGSPARSFRFLNPDGTTAASFSGANWIVVRTR